MSLTSAVSRKPANGEVLVTIAEAKNTVVKGAIAYWQSLRGERRFPMHRELTLRGMASFLPFTVVADVIDDGADYKYRYVGDAERQAFKVYFKGIKLSQVEAHAPAFGGVLRKAYDHLRTTGVPFLVQGPSSHSEPDSALPHHESVFLPLGSEKVEQLLIVGVQVPAPFWDVSEAKLKTFSGLVR